MDMEKIIYPIGRGNLEDDITPANIEKWIKNIEEVPRLLRESVDGLKDAQLDTPYREGGWTIRQLVHHLADSNINNTAGLSPSNHALFLQRGAIENASTVCE